MAAHLLLLVGRVYYNEWVEDRRDESGIRRLKRYEREIRKRLSNKKILATERAQLEINLATVQEAIHQFHIKGLVSTPTTQP